MVFKLVRMTDPCELCGLRPDKATLPLAVQRHPLAGLGVLGADWQIVISVACVVRRGPKLLRVGMVKLP
jgi:hypothetical protein